MSAALADALPPPAGVILLGALAALFFERPRHLLRDARAPEARPSEARAEARTTDAPP
ncbi:hypothetical protein ACQE98_09610 [Ornithinimicrobium sp. W1679]|uniref:hypothetical protein n=1 Tax=Ornithinimicrobium sp. W1679 TaxID=3418770 RepID=UPI003CF3EBA9